MWRRGQSNSRERVIAMSCDESRNCEPTPTPEQIMHNNAGARASRVTANRSVVTIYDGIAAQLDVSGGRWQTVCETHGHVVAHATLRLARAHYAYPWGWCESCEPPTVVVDT